MTAIEQLQEVLSGLGLGAIEVRLEGLLEQAAKTEPSYGDFLREVGMVWTKVSQRCVGSGVRTRPSKRRYFATVRGRNPDPRILSPSARVPFYNLRSDTRMKPGCISRRAFLAGTAAMANPGRVQPAARDRALVSITLDLEMSRNFPTWDQVHWDYEKGNLDEATKRYALQAAQRVRERGGVIHFFVVGRVFEQEDVRWLREIADMGHAIGNHTYDHVNLLAWKAEEIQQRFSRAPWLVRKPPLEFLRENIRMTSEAMERRLGIRPSGFRTPNGYAQGLSGRKDLQQMLLDEGFQWISAKYPRHPFGTASESVFQAIRDVQPEAQPFRYEETPLLDIPMSPISDIGAFRAGRWKLESFLRAIRVGVESAIEQKAVYDFLGHPSCLLATDPQMKSIDLILDMVRDAGRQAAVKDLAAVAAEFGAPHA